MGPNHVRLCWQAHEQLLQKEGLIESHLQQAWQAVCSSISSSLRQGRGYKLSGLCTILPSTPAAAAAAAGQAGGQPGHMVLLSDQLLKVAPQLQLGRGCVHHASVKQQVQGVETLNTAKLTYRFAQGLSQEAIKLALRVLIDTVGKQLKLRQACTVDLGVGQLRFGAGAGVAEFVARATGCCQQQPPAAPALPQPCSAACEGNQCNSSSSIPHSGAASQTSNSSSCSHQHSSHQLQAAATPQAVTGGKEAAAAARTRPAVTATTTAAVPQKPINCDYDATAAWEIAREVRTAAAQNARVKPAGFVLPAGGPGDEDGQPRMPQGKGKHTTGPTPAQQQVVAAAAVRLQHEAAERAAQEAATLSVQALRLSTLNQQAQAKAHQKRVQKQQLAADLAQQMQDKASRAPGRLDGGEQALVVSGKPDPAAVRQQKLRQQAEYRAFLDTQLASAKGRRQQCDQSEDLQLRQQHKQLVQAVLGPAGDPSAYV